MNTTHLTCTCGAVRIDARGEAIASVECCCMTCREAGERLERLDGAPAVRTAHGTTPFVMYRKDRVEIPAGMELLAEHRLEPEAPTRRIVATCCNTPVFLEFRGGHWLSIFGHLWTDDARPPLQLRTMTRSLDDPNVLPDDGVPGAKRQNAWFFRRLLCAWAAMRFRAPKLEIEETIHA